MIHRLREYIDVLFQEAPPTRKTVEMKEEILQNLTEKYNDLLSEGKTEEAAYNIAIASVGDLSELIRELKLMPQYSEQQEEEFYAYRQKKAMFTSIAVALYILSVVSFILFPSRVGVVLFFIMIAAATGSLIYINMNRPRHFTAEETVADEFRVWRENSSGKKELQKTLSSVLWIAAVVIYILYSFSTGNFHISWVIFLIATAANAILKAVFDLRK